MILPLLLISLVHAESALSENILAPSRGLLDSMIGFNMSWLLSNDTIKPTKCFGVKIDVPKNHWSQIKKIRENKYWNDQGEAWCLAMQHVCANRCRPLIITEMK